MPGPTLPPLQAMYQPTIYTPRYEIVSRPLTLDTQERAFEKLRGVLPQLTSVTRISTFLHQGHEFAAALGEPNCLTVWDLDSTDTAQRVAVIRSQFPIEEFGEVAEFDSRYLMIGVIAHDQCRHYHLTRLDYALKCYAAGDEVLVPAPSE